MYVVIATSHHNLRIPVLNNFDILCKFNYIVVFNLQLLLLIGRWLNCVRY